MRKFKFVVVFLLVVPGMALAAMDPPERYVPGLSPSPPAGLSAYWGGSEIHLEWNENPEANLIGYVVYRSLAKAYGFDKLNEGDSIDNDLDGDTDEDGELVAGNWYEDKSSDLDSDRVYYYRVTAVVEGYFESNWSELVDSGDTEDESLFGCFIATAAYGDISAPEVQLLQAFRDRFLVSNVPGRLFVRTYYKLGPPAARVLEKHPLLKQVVKKHLSAVVFLCRLSLRFRKILPD